MFFRENSTYGFEIRNYVDNSLFFKNRPFVRTYSLARTRVFDLARDRKYRDKTMTFAIWDGCNAISKIQFRNGKFVYEKPYLQQPEHIEVVLSSGDKFVEKEKIQKLGLERDEREWKNLFIKHQKTGKVAGDTSKWIKTEHVEPEKACKEIKHIVR